MSKKLTAVQEILTDLALMEDELSKCGKEGKIGNVFVKRIKDHIIKEDYLLKEQIQIINGYRQGHTHARNIDLSEGNRYYNETYNHE